MKILVRFSCKILLLINASTVSTRANESWDQDNTSKERRWQYTVSHILGATLGNPKIMVRGALAAQQHGQFIAGVCKPNSTGINLPTQVYSLYASIVYSPEEIPYALSNIALKAGRLTTVTPTAQQQAVVPPHCAPIVGPRALNPTHGSFDALPLQQAQHIAPRRVGLNEHRGGALLQDLVLARLITVWVNRLETTPNFERWMLTFWIATLMDAIELLDLAASFTGTPASSIPASSRWS